jgi:hypothetical protein
MTAAMADEWWHWRRYAKRHATDGFLLYSYGSPKSFSASAAMAARDDTR